LTLAQTKNSGAPSLIDAIVLGVLLLRYSGKVR
jgi:hypothetical protein